MFMQCLEHNRDSINAVAFSSFQCASENKKGVVYYTREHKEVFKCHVRIVFYFLKEINI